MKLLITGASGFLGRHVVAEALRREHHVRAQVRSMSDIDGLHWEHHPCLEVHRADLRSRDRLDELVNGVDVVIHAAADKTGDFYAQFAANVVGTENLLLAMEAAGVQRMVHISTFSVYHYLAIPNGGLIDEDSSIDDSPNDRDDYAKTKLLQERLIREHAHEHDLKVTHLRPGMIFGRDNLFLARLGLDLSDKLWVRIGGSTLIPISYVENCADAVIAAAEHESCADQTIDVIDDDPPTHRRYIEELRKRIEPKPTVVPVPWWLMRGLARSAWLFNKLFFGGEARLPGILRPAALHARFKPHLYSNDRLKQVLNWRQRFDLTDALDRSLGERDTAALEHDSNTTDGAQTAA